MKSFEKRVNGIRNFFEPPLCEIFVDALIITFRSVSCYVFCRFLLNFQGSMALIKVRSLSHIIHTGSCRYANRNHLLATNRVAKCVIFQGNRVCKICGCEDEWNRLQWGVSSGVKQNNRAEYLRELPLTDENMSMICNKFRLDYNIASDMVFIRTPFSGWIVHIQNDRVTKLRHENYRQRRDEALKIHKKCFEGYHKQKLPSSRFYDVVSYIKYHDEGMLKRLGDKRSRIDIILDRIREQKAENMA